MSRVFINSLLSFSRRAYSVAADSMQTMRSAQITATTTALEPSESMKKEVFWMKDPKTGYWIPESHFDEVDPADLRAQLLGKK